MIVIDGASAVVAMHHHVGCHINACLLLLVTTRNLDLSTCWTMCHTLTASVLFIHFVSLLVIVKELLWSIAGVETSISET